MKHQQRMSMPPMITILHHSESAGQRRGVSFDQSLDACRFFSQPRACQAEVLQWLSHLRAGQSDHPANNSLQQFRRARLGPPGGARVEATPQLNVHPKEQIHLPAQLERRKHNVMRYS